VRHVASERVCDQLHLLRGVATDVDDRIELATTKCAQICVAITAQFLYIGKQFEIVLTTIKQRDAVSVC
jgi:hypothetical protein